MDLRAESCCAESLTEQSSTDIITNFLMVSVVFTHTMILERLRE